MRRPSLAFLAVLPLLQQMPKGYVPSKEFGYGTVAYSWIKEGALCLK